KFVAFVKKHGNKVLVVEDHYPEGGLGEMIKSALHDDPCMVEHLAVMKMPHSGKQQELMRLHKIDAAAIVGKAGRMVRR
ncbi:MAG: transketolase C-terminal domain-containing protein, partial [Candidatus Nanoarchaeia archaeon]